MFFEQQIGHENIRGLRMLQQERLTQGIWIALEMERRGRNLYHRAQKVVEDPLLLSVLHELECEEVQHHEMFQEMINGYGYEDISEEDGELMLAKASTFFFPGGLMQVAMQGALESPLSLIEEAIEAEDSSIAFYSQLLPYSGEKEREIISRIIEEEQRHLRTLQEKKCALQKDTCH